MMALNTGKSFGTNFGILLSIIDFIRTVKSERFLFYYLRIPLIMYSFGLFQNFQPLSKALLVETQTRFWLQKI